MRRDGLASSAKAFGFESEVLTAEALEEPADRPADDAALVDRQVDVRSAVGGRGKGVVTVIVVLVLVASTATGCCGNSSPGAGRTSNA